MKNLNERTKEYVDWEKEVQSYDTHKWASLLNDLTEFERLVSEYVFKEAKYGNFLNGKLKLNDSLENLSFDMHTNTPFTKFKHLNFNRNDWYGRSTPGIIDKWPKPKNHLATSPYYKFHYISIDTFFKTFKSGKILGSEIWNLIDNPKLNNYRKLSRFKNSDDINSIDDIKKELSKIMKDVNDPIEEKIIEIHNLQENDNYDFIKYQKLEEELIKLQENAREVQFDIIEETNLKPSLYWGENIPVEIDENTIGGEDRAKSIQALIDHITSIVSSILSPIDNTITYEDSVETLDFIYEELSNYLRSDFKDLNLNHYHDSENSLSSGKSDSIHKVPNSLKELLKMQNKISPDQRQDLYQEIDDLKEKILTFEDELYGSKIAIDLAMLYERMGNIYSQLDNYFEANDYLEESLKLFSREEIYKFIAENHFKNFRYKHAEKNYTIILIENDNPEYYLKRALCYYYQNFYDKALSDLQNALDKNFEVDKIQDLMSIIKEEKH